MVLSLGYLKMIADAAGDLEGDVVQRNFQIDSDFAEKVADTLLVEPDRNNLHCWRIDRLRYTHNYGSDPVGRMSNFGDLPWRN